MTTIEKNKNNNTGNHMKKGFWLRLYFFFANFVLPIFPSSQVSLFYQFSRFRPLPQGKERERANFEFLWFPHILNFHGFHTNAISIS